MTKKEIDQLTPDQLQELDIESQRAWEDKKREQSREAMQTHREYAGKEMNEKKKNQEIAKACGWVRVPDGWYSPNGTQWSEPPLFTKCLNAMHEAEETLMGDRIDVYQDLLSLICGGMFWKYCTAPAFKRAEAFLKTIGKWEEEK